MPTIDQIFPDSPVLRKADPSNHKTRLMTSQDASLFEQSLTNSSSDSLRRAYKKKPCSEFLIVFFESWKFVEIIEKSDFHKLSQKIHSIQNIF